MNLGIKDLFIGVVHLFVIFLPGAFVLLALGYVAVNFQVDFLSVAGALNLGAPGLSLLVLALSYLLGHFVSLAGAWLEDRRPPPLHSLERGLQQATLRRVAYRICESRLGEDLLASWYQLRRWSAILVRRDSEVFRGEVEAKDADRRFFRNIRVVAVILLLAALLDLVWSRSNTILSSTAALGAALMLVLSTLRYRNQDARYTRLVFESLVATNMAGTAASGEIEPAFTHAGGVVFRENTGTLQYLVVTSTATEREWVLPKGHMHPQESPEQAARREVAEEAGVEASILNFLGAHRFVIDHQPICIAWYLMQFDAEADPAAAAAQEPPREREWLSYEQAFDTLTFDEAKQLLKTAARLTEPPTVTKQDRARKQ
jgi:8-oxo-dGTP pyrophosphatase MutT (NUDIX family)